MKISRTSLAVAAALSADPTITGTDSIHRRPRMGASRSGTRTGGRHSPAISQSDAPETRKKMSMSVAGPAWPVRPPRAAARQPRSPAVAAAEAAAAAGYF